MALSGAMAEQGSEKKGFVEKQQHLFWSPFMVEGKWLYLRASGDQIQHLPVVRERSMKKLVAMGIV